RFGERHVAFSGRRVLRGEPLERLDARQWRLAFVNRTIDLREFGMGRGAPSALDGLGGTAALALFKQQPRMMGGPAREILGHCLRLACESQRPPPVSAR